MSKVLKGMTVPEIEPFELSKRLLNLLFGFTMTKHIATHVLTVSGQNNVYESLDVVSPGCVSLLSDFHRGTT